MTGHQYATAIVGCGKIAGQADRPRTSGPVGTHAQAYVRHGAFRIEAVCDPREERRVRFAEVWGVPRTYGSLGDLLEHERPRVISVCSDTALHASEACDILRAHPSPPVVFVEKPVCTTAADLDHLHRVASTAGAAILVNHSRRFDPAHQRLAALIRRGELGPLVHGRCDYYGGWLHNGCHMVDTLRMLFGALTIDHVAAGAPGRPGDPCIDVRLLADGAPIEMTGSNEQHFQLFEMDLRFERGRVLVRDFGEQIVVQDVEINAIGERVLVPRADSPWAGLDSPLLHAVGAIRTHLDTGSGLDSTGATLKEACETMKVLWQAVAQV